MCEILTNEPICLNKSGTHIRLTTYVSVIQFIYKTCKNLNHDKYSYLTFCFYFFLHLPQFAERALVYSCCTCLYLPFPPVLIYYC